MSHNLSNNMIIHNKYIYIKESYLCFIKNVHVELRLFTRAYGQFSQLSQTQLHFYQGKTKYYPPNSFSKNIWKGCIALNISEIWNPVEGCIYWKGISSHGRNNYCAVLLLFSMVNMSYSKSTNCRMLTKLT